MRKYLKILLLLLILTAVFLAVRFSDIRFENITAENVRSYLLSFGILQASAIYVAIYALSLRPFIPIPPTLYTIAGGFTFGPVLGTVLTVIGATLNASISFMLARLLGKDFVDRIFRGRIDYINRKLRDSGFKTLLIIRSSPVGLPFDLVSYASGVLRISFWSHFFATMLGIIPAVAVYSYFGGSITKGGFYILVGFFLIVLFSILIPWMIRKRRIKKHETVSLEE